MITTYKGYFLDIEDVRYDFEIIEDIAFPLMNPRLSNGKRLTS
jgi:hypothetical protein